VAITEFFIEIYCCFSDGLPEYKSLKESVYWYVSDYSDDFVEYRVREQIDPSINFATNIIMNADLTDVRYLYSFGEYISDNELKTSRYLNTLTEEQIRDMAHTFTEGYRKGFELGRKDLSKKKSVNIRYTLGFERLVREEIRQFKELGLETTVYRAASNSINKRMHIKVGYFGGSPNRQMDYDHRFDNALYLNSTFVERKLGALKLAYEKNAELAGVFGGPAVMETFGETPFEPIEKKECLRLTERQQKLSVKYDNESSAIVNRYIKGEERSFTIIAYPVDEIGADYEEIFAETVKINTLDYDQYRIIQERIIDALNGAEYVEVKGCGNNVTDMKVSIMPVTDKASQTVFENCLADVNIPLGEVFTSPVLAGTEGALNVSEVYLNDYRFKNLTVNFKDGMVTDYSCENFDDDEKNRAFFRENVLYSHDTLPIGEFAIGTNTTAYRCAKKYDILYKLPILIVEKMGPHFALGDTCYSRSEDVTVYNPDGKEIISRDNEVSLLRKTEPDKAYFNCHTDITIPYDEIGAITAVHADGQRIEIIKNGKFVLEGCEKLNEALREI
jgi:leucyl aminopeptidase (aminopeptidase T)